MGSRGQYYSGKSRSIKSRAYDSAGNLRGIKLLVQRLGNNENASLPMHSNTSDIYAVIDKSGTVQYIGLYEDNNLVRSFDLGDSKNGKIHAHDWETVPDPKGGYPITRRAKSGGDAHDSLTADEKKIVRKVLRNAKRQGFKIPPYLPFK